MTIGFQEIRDSIVITRSKGVHKQLTAYHRKGYIYVGTAGGFVLLRKEGNTNMPNLVWEEHDLGFAPKYNAVGRMMKP